MRNPSTRPSQLAWSTCMPKFGYWKECKQFEDERACDSWAAYGQGWEGVIRQPQMWVQYVGARSGRTASVGKYRARRSRVGVGVRTKSLVQLPEITENHDDSGCMVKSQPCNAGKRCRVGWKSGDKTSGVMRVRRASRDANYTATKLGQQREDYERYPRKYTTNVEKSKVK